MVQSAAVEPDTTTKVHPGTTLASNGIGGMTTVKVTDAVCCAESVDGAAAAIIVSNAIKNRFMELPSLDEKPQGSVSRSNRGRLHGTRRPFSIFRRN
jgi:hypothetical protein